MRRIQVVFFVLGVAAVLPGQVRPLPLSELCSKADRIVIGGVSKLECRWQGTMIMTDVTIAPIENLKASGNVPFVVTIPGGTIGGVTLHASEVPEFATGELTVLFIKNTAAPCSIYGWEKGKFSVAADQIKELPGTALGQFRQSILDNVKH